VKEFSDQKLNFGFRRRVPLILQAEAAECGLACLAMVANYHGNNADMLTLRQRFSISLRGVKLGTLIDIASQMGFCARPLRLDICDLGRLHRPRILHWNLNHFVVLVRVLPNNSGVVINDPATGENSVSATDVSAQFTGIALELLPTDQFRKDKKKPKIRIRDILGKTIGIKRAFLQIFSLALALEAFALVGPFLMQWIVDGAITSGDQNLTTLIVWGLFLLLILQTGIATFRSWVVLYIATHLNLQFVANVFTHLLRLPVTYFEKRHIGDIVSRFGAVGVIQRTLTTNFVEATLDGLMAIATIVMMFLYSTRLTIVTLASLLIYTLMRWLLYAPLRRASEENIALAAKEQTLFLESIRCVQSIKLFNHEDARRARWLNAVVAATNRSIATQKMTLAANAAHTFVSGAENLLIIWMGAGLVMTNSFSVGMLFSFISYKSSFTSRVYSLIDKWSDFKMLSLQTDRLADIVLSEPESQPSRLSYDLDNSEAVSLVQHERDLSDMTLELKSVAFRYSSSEPLIFSNVNLTISPNESVAIVGPSGCGKSTLVKLMLGLLKPTAGEIFLGGIPLEKIGIKNYRKLLGTVMQEDQLLAGSIADNVVFFDPQVNQQWMEKCAKLAAIHDEINAMPMGYQTLIGDVGTALSSGQKQRLLLARALYRRPKILFLDEATSHLDIECEKRVNDSVKSLSLTRIIIAHRPETIKTATRVYELGGRAVLAEI
jgi:ATP-binding cassette subfamily B protein RaxB